MIRMIVSQDQILHGLRRERLDLRENVLVNSLVLRIDSDDAFIGQRQRDISTVSADLCNGLSRVLDEIDILPNLGQFR
jgi:hypothetical protein